MPNANYKEDISLLSMIRKLSDGLMKVVEQVSSNSTKTKLLEDRVALLEDLLSGKNIESSSTETNNQTTDAATVSIVYNRIKNDLQEGKIVPLKAHNSDTIQSVSLEEFKTELHNVSDAIKRDISSGNALVSKSKDSDMVGGMTINDILHEVDIKLSKRYLENGQFLINKYDITEDNTTRVDLNIEDNNRAIIVSINGLLDKYKYTMDGNTLVFEEPLKKDDYVLVYSFKELQLLDDTNLNRLLNLIEDNRQHLLAKVEETMLSDEYIDQVLATIDSKLADFSIIDGKVKIEDDALVSNDNGENGNSDWDLLN